MAPSIGTTFWTPLYKELYKERINLGTVTAQWSRWKQVSWHEWKQVSWHEEMGSDVKWAELPGPVTWRKVFPKKASDPGGWFPAPPRLLRTSGCWR